MKPLWLHPEYAWAFAGVVIILLSAAGLFRYRRRALRMLGEGPLVLRQVEGLSQMLFVFRWSLRVLAAILLVVALMGPRYGTTPREVKREGVDLMIALDVSNSMLAEDVAPNRLMRAKHEIRRLLDVLDGDRVGLVLFAGDAFIQCPLTDDYEALRLFLDIADPTLMPAQGTNLGAAIRAAIQAFEGAAAPGKEPPTRVLLLISDGENHEGSVSDLKDRAREAGVVLLAAGVGSPGGAPLPVYREGQKVGYRRDDRGRVIQTRLVEADLRALAVPGGYVHIGRAGGSLASLTRVLDTLQSQTFETAVYEDYEERYAWPLTAALFVLLLEALFSPLSIRRSKRVTA